MNFPRSTQIITQASPINGSPYGRGIMGLMINPQNPANAIYNYAEANTVGMMQMTGDDGAGFYNKMFYNMQGNMGSMLSGGNNTYTYYPSEPYRFGFYPVGYPVGMNAGFGQGIPVMYAQGFPRF